MLDGFGLHSLIWNLADQVVPGIFVASPMDARGRGIVDASVMLLLGDGRYLSTRDFNIRVERVLIDGLEPEDGFMLCVLFNYAKVKFTACEPRPAKFCLILQARELEC